MNFKKWVLFSIVSMSLLTSAAQANIVLLAGGQDICNDVTGTWVGKGSVSTRVSFFTIRCYYNGDARVTSPSDPHQLLMDVHLTKMSGPFCPSEENFQMTGTCNSDGNILINNELSNLHGIIQQQNGNYVVDLGGSVTMPINGISVSASVDSMHLQKQS